MLSVDQSRFYYFHDRQGRKTFLPSDLVEEIKKGSLKSLGRKVKWEGFKSDGMQLDRLKPTILALFDKLGKRYKFIVDTENDGRTAVITRVPGLRPLPTAIMNAKPARPESFRSIEEQMLYEREYDAWRETFDGKKLEYSSSGRKLASEPTKYDFDSLNIGEERTYTGTNTNALRVAFFNWKKRRHMEWAKLDIVPIDDATLLVSRVA